MDRIMVSGTIDMSSNLVGSTKKTIATHSYRSFIFSEPYLAKKILNDFIANEATISVSRNVESVW